MTHLTAASSILFLEAVEVGGGAGVVVLVLIILTNPCNKMYIRVPFSYFNLRARMSRIKVDALLVAQ